jgi:hypothetical protein
MHALQWLELNPQTVRLAPLINEVIGTAGQLAEQNKKSVAGRAHKNPELPAHVIDKAFDHHLGQADDGVEASRGRSILLRGAAPRPSAARVC